MGKKKLALGVTAMFYAISTVVARRKGYKFGGNTIVRCRRGHVFTTVWIPGASIKAVRLGWARLQRCPVGRHWSLVVPVREADLSPSERDEAHDHHDAKVP